MKIYNIYIAAILLFLSICVDAQAEGRSQADAPGEVEGLSATPDPDGLKIVDITFKTPAKTVSGNKLDAAFNVCVKRDDIEIKNIANARPGVKYIVVDENVPNGWHIYSVSTLNEEGQGRVVTTNCYVGVNRPAAVTDVRVVETGNREEVKITWAAPKTDIDGKALNDKYLSYDILTRQNNGDYITVAKAVKQTEYVCHADNGFVNYCVVAVNDAGVSEYSECFYTYVGNSAPIPYCESGYLKQDVYLLSNDADFTWLFNENNIQPVDGDNKLFCYKAKDRNVEKDACGILVLGKIEVSDPETALSLYIYNYQTGSNIVNIYVVCEGRRSRLANITPSNLYVSGWNKIIIPLKEFTGKSVVPVFEVVCVNAHETALDRIEIANVAKYDLEISCFNMPETCLIGTQFNISARVTNIGTQTAKGWKAVLIHNGMAEQEIEGELLESGQASDIEFECRFDETSPAVNSYCIRLNYGDDTNNDNNSTEIRSLNLQNPDSGVGIANSNHKYTINGNVIETRNCRVLKIYSIDGRILAEVEAGHTISLQKGLYILITDSAAERIVVK